MERETLNDLFGELQRSLAATELGEILQNAVEKKAGEHFDIAQQGSSSQEWLHPPGDLARAKRTQKNHQGTLVEQKKADKMRKGMLCKM